MKVFRFQAEPWLSQAHTLPHAAASLMFVPRRAIPVVKFPCPFRHSDQRECVCGDSGGITIRFQSGRDFVVAAKPAKYSPDGVVQNWGF